MPKVRAQSTTAPAETGKPPAFLSVYTASAHVEALGESVGVEYGRLPVTLAKEFPVCALLAGVLCLSFVTGAHGGELEGSDAEELQKASNLFGIQARSLKWDRGCSTENGRGYGVRFFDKYRKLIGAKSVLVVRSLDRAGPSTTIVTWTDAGGRLVKTENRDLEEILAEPAPLRKGDPARKDRRKTDDKPANNGL
jgi:hypothetical protein